MKSDTRPASANGRRTALTSLLSAGSVAAIAALLPENAAATPTENLANHIYNVRDYGAIGDGSANDTAAFMQAILAAASAATGNAVLYIPNGVYSVTSTLNMHSGVRQIVGDGPGSVIKNSSSSHLFYWPASAPIAGFNARNFSVSIGSGLRGLGAAIFCSVGQVVNATFENLILTSDASGVRLTAACNNISFQNCVISFTAGVGLEVGSGSEVRVFGGRVVGNRTTNSIGVHLTGGMGGFHLIGTDVSTCYYGLLIENITGVQNREIFLTHATLDSCWRGLAIRDNVYVSIVGCWLASSDQENLWVDAGFTGSLIAISGGTIFNAGNYLGASGPGNGMTINSGSFTLDGVNVRSNKGVGLWIPNGAVINYTITGCRFTFNGQALNIAGSSFIVSSNLFSSNSIANQIGGSNKIVVNNLGI